MSDDAAAWAGIAHAVKVARANEAGLDLVQRRMDRRRKQPLRRSRKARIWKPFASLECPAEGAKVIRGGSLLCHAS